MKIENQRHGVLLAVSFFSASVHGALRNRLRGIFPFITPRRGFSLSTPMEPFDLCFLEQQRVRCATEQRPSCGRLSFLEMKLPGHSASYAGTVNITCFVGAAQYNKTPLLCHGCKLKLTAFVKSGTYNVRPPCKLPTPFLLQAKCHSRCPLFQ